MRIETIDKLADERGLTRDDILEYDKNDWIKKESRVVDDLLYIKPDERLEFPSKDDEEKTKEAKQKSSANTASSSETPSASSQGSSSQSMFEKMDISKADALSGLAMSAGMATIIEEAKSSKSSGGGGGSGAKKFGARKGSKYTIISSAPSVNKTQVGNAVVPIPYPVNEKYSGSDKVSEDVNFNGKGVFTMDANSKTVKECPAN